MNLNKAMIIGNLTRDPEVKNTPNGATVATFSVATNMVWTDQSGQKQERVEFHNMVAWRKLADICGQYLRKGSKVYVEGRLQTNSWEKDGVKHYRTEIVVENMIMLDRPGQAAPSSGGNYGQPARQEFPSNNNEQIIDVQDDSQMVSEEEIKVENIPF
jgi:single-strand DNA-binding protein